MHTKHLKPAIEAILFLHQKPVSLNKIRNAIDEELDMSEYKTALDELITDYSESTRGIEIVKVAGGIQIRTKLEHKDMIRRMNAAAPIRMSQAMLEVLSIVAFNQPATRERVEEIRGVECGQHLRNLMDRHLCKMVGRSDSAGRPILYGTTKEFLEIFALESLRDLPSLRDIEDMLPQNEVGAPDGEEERVRGELQAIVSDAKELEFNNIELEELKVFEELDARDAADKEAKRLAKAEAKEKAQQDTKATVETTEAESEQTDETIRETPESIETKSTDSDTSPTENEPTPQGIETGHSEHQSDEVAGSISFGQVSKEQEAEWNLDEKAEPTPNNANQNREEQGATTSEDLVDGGDLQPEESRRADSSGPSDS